MATREPTEADLIAARAWRRAQSRGDAWRIVCSIDERWDHSADTHVFEADEGVLATFNLHARRDARSLVICEKDCLRRWLEEWAGPDAPSVAHARRLATATMHPAASTWSLATVTAHAQSLGVKLGYVGDLDPSSIHHFAALRAGGHERLLAERAQRFNVRWAGVSDALLARVCEALGVSEVPQQMLITMPWSEREYWELVKSMLVRDAKRIVGARAFAMLESGVKLEIDALVVRAGKSKDVRDALSKYFATRMLRGSSATS
jgi:hypothetical protein